MLVPQLVYLLSDTAPGWWDFFLFVRSRPCNPQEQHTCRPPEACLTRDLLKDS